MPKTMLENFATILEKKIAEGIKALETTSVKSKEYSTLLANIWDSSKIHATLVFKPAKPEPAPETKGE